MITKYDVFIPTKNSSKTIFRVLEGIKRSGIPVNNLVVVDDSIDNTRNLIENWCEDNSVNLVFSDQKEPGIGYARFVGSTLVETKFYCSVDSDMILPKGWFDKMKMFLSDDILQVQSYPIFGEPNNRMYLFYNLMRLKEIPQITGGCNIINHENLVKIGNYNQKLLIGEDMDLYNRSLKSEFKTVFVYNTFAVNPRTYYEELKHSFWWGKAFLPSSFKDDLINLFRGVEWGLIMFFEDPLLLFMVPFRNFVWFVGRVLNRMGLS